MKERLLFFKLRNWSDPEDFGKLYDMYVDKIYRFVYFKVGSKEEAQDITSQTFLKAWQYLGIANNDDVRNIGAFLYRVARNLVIDFFRTKGAEMEWQENIDQLEGQDHSAEIIDSLEKEVDREMVLQAIQKLRPIHQEMIMMRYLEDLGISSIAQVINKSNGATRVLLHRALKELKTILNEKP